MDETDRLFTCEYCRVKSYLVQKDYFRYMLPNAAPEDEKLIFFPYWRFKGMLFSCVSDGIQHRFMDVSYQALESRHFPESVGLRSQALKLKFVTPESPGRFLEPTLSFEEVMHLFMERFRSSLPKPVFLQSHIGETLSLIYSPFRIDKKIIDGVLNKPIAANLPDDFDVTLLPGGRPDWRIQFMPTLCPGCGWDMHGERDALVLNCKNCNSAWQPGKIGFKKLKFGHMPGKDKNMIYLPFWRFSVDVSGIVLDSYADFVRVANLPRAIQDGWHDMGFFFWALGFKVSPQNFISLSRKITLSQPKGKPVNEVPNARLFPVTLPVEEAFESLKINLASFMKPRSTLFPKLDDINITPKNTLLTYIPFNEKHHELVQPDLNIAINKNQLTMAKNL
ncbi:hypothetical protein ACFL03_10235 [Thermodesulfobacteriota bacterium]